MDRQGDDKPAARRPMIEPLAWIGCILAAVMPTAVLASIAQKFDRTDWPLFAPLLFIGVFTIMVLAVRPWSFR